MDLNDLALLLAAYDTCDGDSDFDPRADFDDSGCSVAPGDAGAPADWAWLLLLLCLGLGRFAYRRAVA